MDFVYYSVGDSVIFFYLLGHSNLITCLTSFLWTKNTVRLQKN